jgi:predicted GIY-YIG superfamily endonuclease
MYAVYALIDPDELYKVCYIGMTQDVYTRFTQHLRDVDSSSLKGKWLKELRKRNRVPYCKVLEEILTQEEAAQRETYWINFYRQLNMPLTNANIPQVTQGTQLFPPPDPVAVILDLYDKGMSGRSIEKMLKERQVSYRTISKTLDLHRPGWAKRGMDEGNSTVTNETKVAENVMDAQNPVTGIIHEAAS